MEMKSKDTVLAESAAKYLEVSLKWGVMSVRACNINYPYVPQAMDTYAEQFGMWAAKMGFELIQGVWYDDTGYQISYTDLYKLYKKEVGDL